MTTMSDVLYVIGPEQSQTVKIGFSNKPRRRLRDIQMMSPLPLTILWSCPGGNPLEKALHSRFRQYRSHGEWFTFPPHLKPVPTIMNAAEALLQYALTSSGSINHWADVPICTKQNRKHWLNRRIKEGFYRRPFTLAEVAEAIGAPTEFVETYGAELARSKSIVEQTPGRSDPKIYMTAWDDDDRWSLLGPRPERTSAME